MTNIVNNIASSSKPSKPSKKTSKARDIGDIMDEEYGYAEEAKPVQTSKPAPITQLVSIIETDGGSTFDSKGGNIIYTDGSCLGNGRKNSSAGFGIYVKSLEKIKELKLSKKIERTSISFNEKNGSFANPSTTITYEPSNNRAEGGAILYALILIKELLLHDKTDLVDAINNSSIYPLKKYTTDLKEFNISSQSTNEPINITIISDSKLWINIFGKWINKWIRTQSIFEKKNIDLVYQIYYNLVLLRENNIFITLKHINGHPELRKNQCGFNNDEMGIFVADQLATGSYTNVSNQVEQK
jgi:ribonuclease HI